MYDPICDVINYCVWSCDMDKNSVYMMKLWLKNWKHMDENKRKFYVNFHVKAGFGVEYDVEMSGVLT